MTNRLEPLEDPVGDLFVNRQEEFDLFARWVGDIPWRPNNSYALIGRRRTGKTAILIKLFNQLFYEQTRVMPVYISFAEYRRLDRPLTFQEVGDHFMASYLACFFAFRYQRPELLRSPINIDSMRRLAHEISDPIINEILLSYDAASEKRTTGDGPARFAIHVPRSIAGVQNILTVIIIDEFQVLTNIYDPVQNVFHDLTDSFQKPVESRVAPMLVSGSAVSLLVGQALGGMLSGRFGYRYLKPLTREHAYELVFRLAVQTNMPATTEFAEAIWQLTGGYPYSISNLLYSDCPARQQLPALDALEAVVLFELGDVNGRLWQHYTEEFVKYSDLLNHTQLTKKVMFWAVKYPDQEIDAKRIAQELGVDFDEVQTTLRKLHQADIVYKIGWTLYEGPGDPMLRRYIEYNYRREIEELSQAEAIKDWQREIRQIRGHLNQARGEIGELYVRMVMRGFDGRSVDGAVYFNHPGTVLLPKFDRIERRGGIVSAGQTIEIDVLAEWSVPDPTDNPRGIWLVEAKYTEERIGVQAVNHFLANVKLVQAEAKYASITCWFFAKAGFTPNAEQALQQAGIYYSNWEQFYTLAYALGFLGLPKA